MHRERAGRVGQHQQLEFVAAFQPIADFEAYEKYLTARARMRERGAGVNEAVRLFEEVVAADSTWAPGWAAPSTWSSSGETSSTNTNS